MLNKVLGEKKVLTFTSKPISGHDMAASHICSLIKLCATKENTEWYTYSLEMCYLFQRTASPLYLCARATVCICTCGIVLGGTGTHPWSCHRSQRLWISAAAMKPARDKNKRQKWKLQTRERTKQVRKTAEESEKIKNRQEIKQFSMWRVPWKPVAKCA